MAKAKVTKAKTVKVEVTQSFAYRNANFEAGKVYDIDPELTPNWVEHWITKMGNGVVLAAESDRDAEPDPRVVVDSEPEEKVVDSSDDDSTGSEDLPPEEKGKKKKLTLPTEGDSEPGSEDALGDTPTESDDASPSRPPLGDSDEVLKVTTSENVPPAVHGGRAKDKK